MDGGGDPRDRVICATCDKLFSDLAALDEHECVDFPIIRSANLGGGESEWQLRSYIATAPVRFKMRGMAKA